MRSDLLQDAIGMVKDEYITDAVSAKKKPHMAKVFISIISAAACLCIIMTGYFYLFKGEELPEDKANPIQEDEAKDDFNIVWSGSLPVGEDSDSSDIIEDDSISTIDDALTKAMENGSDDELYACVVATTGGYERDGDTYNEIEKLRQKLSDADEELSKAAEKCADELVSSQGISYKEAWARIYTMPEFINAREAYRNAKKEYTVAKLKAEFEIRQDKVEYLNSSGFKVLFDATNEKYTPYLSVYHNALGVFAATKEQILSLKKNAAGYRLYGAAENADEYIFADFYSDFEFEFEENSKLTKKLTEAYKNAEGRALTVDVNLGYFGKEYTLEEIDALAYEAIGTTSEEFERSATMDIVNKFTEERNKILWHTDYYEDIARKYLHDSEYIELKSYLESVTASLTYERALELCQYNDIAYITLADERPNTKNTDIGLGFDSYE